MIQRIQSIYLLIACLLNCVGPFLFSIWKDGSNTEVFAIDKPFILGGFIFSSILSLVGALSFKSRIKQILIGRFNIILNFILLITFVYRSLSLSGETEVSEKGIGMLLPIFSIVFISLANKAIKKDEDLVKSVDRLR